MHLTFSDVAVFSFSSWRCNVHTQENHFHPTDDSLFASRRKSSIPPDSSLTSFNMHDNNPRPPVSQENKSVSNQLAGNLFQTAV